MGIALHVLRSLKHHVLEEVREAGPARRFVRRADVVPEVDADDGQPAILREDHFEAVRQRVLLDVDCWKVAWRRLRTWSDDSGAHQQHREQSFHFLFSRLAHRYQDATDRYGRHDSPSFNIRAASGAFRKPYAF